MHFRTRALDNYESIEDEARRLMQEMEITIKEVQESKFYSAVANRLQNNQNIHSHISRVLGVDSHVQMVIYALGSIEFSYVSQYQLAIAILLKQDFSWIGDIEGFDPEFTPADCKVMEALGCNMVTHNEQCRRQVEKPTLFFMPSYNYDSMGNLLEANWHSCQLNRMMFLTNSFKHTAKTWKNRKSKLVCDGKVRYDYMSERLEYIKAIHKHTNIFCVRIRCERFENMFQHFGWHFFDLDPQLDLNNLLPADPSKEKRLELSKENDKHNKPKIPYADLASVIERTLMEPFKTDSNSDETNWSWRYGTYRGPRWVRCLSLYPCPGWIKLNISGIGCNGNNPAGFGGVFTNENGEILATYKGRLGEKDKIVANAEALRQGLKCLRHLSPITKLIVEGNDLSFIRWVNDGPEPPKRIYKHLYEIFDLLKDIESVVYHIYDEANSMAIELAKKGTNLCKPEILISSQT